MGNYFLLRILIQMFVFYRLEFVYFLGSFSHILAIIKISKNGSYKIGTQFRAFLIPPNPRSKPQIYSCQDEDNTKLNTL